MPGNRKEKNLRDLGQPFNILLNDEETEEIFPHI
jgi:hypothetical protein